MAKDILKEAIADAKAVREVALANAKAALEEAFTPKLQSMLSAKLSEDLNEEYDEDMDEAYMEDEKEDVKETYMEDEKEEKNEAYMEDEKEEKNEVVGVAAGIAGIIAAAGGLSALEMAAEDPEFKAKYPKVARALEKMQDIGKAAADAKRMEEAAMAEELEETKEALEAVKTELNEVNLLNSKLLYVNRIFKANNLDEAQKLRVVETLDNATNVKEAKLIYETIKDTFTISKNKKTTPKRSIKEGLGMASKAAGTSTAPKKPVLNESNDMVTRMQKLANIKINQ